MSTDWKGLEVAMSSITTLTQFHREEKTGSVPWALTVHLDLSFVCFLFILYKIIIYFLQTKTLHFQGSSKESSVYACTFLVKGCKNGQTAPLDPPLEGTGWWEDCLRGDRMHSGWRCGLWSPNAHHAPVWAQSLTSYVTMDINLTTLYLSGPLCKVGT